MNAAERVQAFFSRIRPRQVGWMLGVGSALIVALAALTLSPSATHAARRAPLFSWKLTQLSKHLNPFRTRHALYQSGLPVYDLKIKAAQYRGIMEIVEEAVARDQLDDDLKQWSKAKFIHNGITRNVKIRVRGDYSLHWRGQRKSWRIRFPKENPLQGQREINLIITNDGKAFYEHFCNALFRRLGVMTLRDGYAVLRINGVPQGVYYQVEHVDKPLFAHLRRAEGTIFGNPRAGLELGSFKEQAVDANEGAYRALQALLDYENDPTAANLAAALAVTDLEDNLRFIAGTTLLCSDQSTFTGDDHKFYFDSSRGAFYRIPWDVEPQPIPGIVSLGMEAAYSTFDIFPTCRMSRLRTSILRTPEHRLRRDRILWSLVRDNSLLKLLDDLYAPVHLAMWCDVMGSGNEEEFLAGLRYVVKHNTQRIRRALAANQVEVRIRHETDYLASLRFALNSASGIVVDSLQVEGGASVAGDEYTIHRDLNGNGRLDPDEPLIARTRADTAGLANFERLAEPMFPDTGVREYFPLAEGKHSTRTLRTVVYSKTTRYEWLLTRQRGRARNGTDAAARPAIMIGARNAVTDERLTERELHVRTHTMREFFEPARRTESRGDFLARYPLFKPDAGNEHGVILPSGSHRIDGIVIVPERITLTIQPGTKLAMGPDASILAFGPIRAIGRADAPIRIGSATDAPWGSVASVQPDGSCVFEHVEVLGGRGATINGVLLTGSLALHGGDVTIRHCRFIGSVGEDGVNIKDASARITNSYFAASAGDAIDLDFVRGEVVSCHFLDSRGDGIDLSGCDLSIRDTRIKGAGDKGISIGERSEARIANTLLQGNTIGLAVKDLSRATVTRCTLIGNTTSVAAYRKKPIFGGGMVTITESIITDSQDPVTTDSLSEAVLRNCLVPKGVCTDACEVARRDLADTLRSQQFVFNVHTTASGRTRSPAGSSGSRFGISAPPIDLR